MRVTSQMQADRVIASLQRQAATQATLQQQVSTGLRLQKPSDGPSDYVAAGRAKAQDQRLAAYLDTATTATSDLNTGVSALQDGTQLLTQAADLASQAINAATDPATYPALAAQVDHVLDRLLAIGNTQFNGRYLFGGTATQSPPFAVGSTDTAGWSTSITYQGADERAGALIGPGQTVETHYAGDQVFQANGSDVFQALITLRDTLRDTTTDATSKVPALTESFRKIESGRTNILQTVGEQSASLETLETVQNRLQDVRLTMQERVADLEGTDFAEAIVRLQEQQTAFQATLSMAARTFSPSLLDFLR